MQTETIQLKLFNNISERFNKVYESYLEITDDYIKKVVDCDCETLKDDNDIKGGVGGRIP